MLAVVSCGSGTGGGPESPVGASARSKDLSDFQYNKNDIVYGEKGSATEGMIVGGRRSQFEGKRQVVFGGEYDQKSFATQDYNTRQWEGKKEVGRKTFSGNTDASRYKVASALGGQDAREASRMSSYAGRAVETSTYGTSSARETRAGAIDRTSSFFADDRYPQPRIMPFRDYQKMTIEETNRLLGRDR